MKRSHTSRGDVLGHRRWGLISSFLVAALLVAGSGCSTDDFGPTGSTLPPDVSQDTLLAEILVVGTVPDGELSFELDANVPPDSDIDQQFEDREILYYGNLQNEGWTGTPLLRFDWDRADTTLLAEYDSIRAIRLQLFPMKTDLDRGIEMTMDLYALSAVLDTTMANAALAGVLGDVLAPSAQALSTAIFDLFENQTPATQQALRDSVRAWVNRGGHTGFAMSDVSGLDSNLVGLASNDFDLGAHRDLLQDDIPSANVFPSISVTLTNTTAGLDTFITPDVLLDLTNMARPGATHALGLASHYPRRCWMEFDLSGVPTTATINNAELILEIDRVQLVATGDADDTESISPQFMNVRSFETTKQDALSGDINLDTVDLVLNGLSSVDLTGIVAPTEPEDRQLKVNLTDYVQRYVNGIFSELDSPPGIMLVFASEELQLVVVEMFDSSSPDSTVMPRVDIRYTPPADFVD